QSARRQRCHHADSVGHVRRDPFRADADGHRSRHQPGFLAQLRRIPRLESRAETARDRMGTSARRVDGAADRRRRRGGAQVDLRHDAADLFRASARRPFRRAALVRRRLIARGQRRARQILHPGPLGGRHAGRRPLIPYLARRLAFAIFLVFAVSSASLVLTRLAPGDFAAAGLPARDETVEQLRERLGLNKSIGAQYVDWIAAAARLDFGESLVYGRPVRDLIPERAANTAVLALTALL